MPELRNWRHSTLWTRSSITSTSTRMWKGMFFAVQKALPLMNDGGSIILTGSIADMKGFPSMSVYSATKAAVRSFARTWTTELKERHIRVNAISPEHIDTPIFDTWQQGD